MGRPNYLGDDLVAVASSFIESGLPRIRQSGRSSGGVPDEMQRIAEAMRQNQKLVTIGRLAGAIAHEINNPLESIGNLLFLMGADPNVSDSVRGYLGMAQRELDRVVQISKQTLNFYREAPSAIRVSLAALLEEVLVLYGFGIAEKNLTVIRQLDSELRALVFPGEMRQVFANLIGNAIEASRNGGKLYVRLRKSRSWNDPGVTGVRITIADNGAGIPAELRRRLGEAFLTTKGQRGTGLGLWVTKSIVNRYGGSMLLYSSTGKHHGSVFSVFLPTNLRPQVVSTGTSPASLPNQPEDEES